jgi:dTDP-4-dehydrorhamnose reductase
MSLELWGGVECTVNRIGDTYFDQIERTGHQNRFHDLDLVASLGITKLRYPVLWERTECAGELQWAWADKRLGRLRELQIDPIVGLLHHGSGPAHTSLIDPDFPQKFSKYARAVAERYPWIENFTPVNEPLTTARFSALYGHWYPHEKSDHAFACSLMQQCQGIVLAMHEIRAVNPAARLIQTEDLGKTFSTPRMTYQARFDNERRWLTFDLLGGRVNQQHPLWKYLLDSGINEADLHWFVDNPCPPDILGVNHYLTSDRYLDERIGTYPAVTHGANNRHCYADVEAVRVAMNGDLGSAARLTEIWQRYRRPVAITEVHIGCSPDEQGRWFLQAWKAAQSQRASGADIRAVTAWALFGSFDWNSLLVRNDNVYEPGVFDIRSGASAPEMTPLAEMLREIADGKQPSNPCVNEPGWWQKPDRIVYRDEQCVQPEHMEHAGRASFHTSA